MEIDAETSESTTDTRRDPGVSAVSTNGPVNNGVAGNIRESGGGGAKSGAGIVGSSASNANAINSSGTNNTNATAITTTNSGSSSANSPGGGTGSASSMSKALFLEKVRQSNAACQAGDFERAVHLYSEAIALEPSNHILYSNRSAAYVKLGQFARALQDANAAKGLKPTWPKVSPRRAAFHIRVVSSKD